MVEVSGLVKRYRSRLRRQVVTALAGLDLVADAGEVVGLLGPNGSGKTTALRTMVGLSRAEAGEVRLFGRPVPADLDHSLPSVGAVVETPRFAGRLTARQTLRLLARTRRLPTSAVDERLEQVGLAGAADRPVRGFSLGMRQRLALASALLRDPRLLLLDEPANGLDPAGIRQLRTVLRSFADAGGTVLLSSHVLGEVEVLADRAVVVNAGRCIGAGPLPELLATGPPRWRVRATGSLDGLERVLAAAGFDAVVEATDVVVTTTRPVEDLSRAVGQDRRVVTLLQPVVPSLEAVYLELLAADTGEQHAWGR